MTVSVECTHRECPMYKACRIKHYAEYCSVHNEYIAARTVRLHVVRTRLDGRDELKEVHVEGVNA